MKRACRRRVTNNHNRISKPLERLTFSRIAYIGDANLLVIQFAFFNNYVRCMEARDETDRYPGAKWLARPQTVSLCAIRIAIHSDQQPYQPQSAIITRNVTHNMEVFVSNSYGHLRAHHRALPPRQYIASASVCCPRYSDHCVVRHESLEMTSNVASSISDYICNIDIDIRGSDI